MASFLNFKQFAMPSVILLAHVLVCLLKATVFFLLARLQTSLVSLSWTAVFFGSRCRPRCPTLRRTWYTYDVHYKQMFSMSSMKLALTMSKNMVIVMWSGAGFVADMQIQVTELKSFRLKSYDFTSASMLWQLAASQQFDRCIAFQDKLLALTRLVRK